MKKKTKKEKAENQSYVYSSDVFGDLGMSCSDMPLPVLLGYYEQYRQQRRKEFFGNSSKGKLDYVG